MMKPIITLTLILTLILTALGLGACGTTRTVTETVYVAVQIDPSFFDPSICQWPRKADYIVNGTEAEASSYDLAGFAAWRCERAGRLGAGARQAEIIRDIEKR